MSKRNIKIQQNDTISYISEVSSYKNKENSVSEDTIFTVFVTIGIFILGVMIERLLKRFDLRSNRKKLKSYFEYHLNRINENLIPRLRDGYREYYQITDINSGITSTPPKVLSGDFERILNINNDELFHVYKERETFSKVLSQIDFVSKVQSEVNEFHKLVLNQSSNLRDELKKLSDEYITLLAEYTKEEKNNKDETYQLLNDSVIYYYQELAGKRELSVFYHKIIRKIQLHLVETKKYLSHPKSAEIAEKGRKLSLVYNELRYKSVEVRIQYRVFSQYVDEIQKNLSNLIINLK